MPRRYPSLRTFKAFYIIPERGSLSEDDECCICFDPYNDITHQAVGVTSNSECEHIFGRQCLEAWLDSTNPNKNTCPVCRRKWYTKRSTSLPTPRDLDTAQVLELSAQAGISLLAAGTRALRRIPRGDLLQAGHDLSVAQQVERLASIMEAMEAWERTSILPLDPEVRVRLQQVEGRMHAFLQRHTTTGDASTGSNVRSQPNAILQSGSQRNSNHPPEPSAPNHDHDQLPARLFHLPHRGTPDRLDFAALSRARSTSQSSRTVLRTRLPLPVSRTGALFSPGAITRQPSYQSRSHLTADLATTEEHVRANGSEAPQSSSPRESRPSLLRRNSLNDMVAVNDNLSPSSFASAAASRAMNGDANRRQHAREGLHRPDQDQFLLPRRQISTRYGTDGMSLAESRQLGHLSTEPLLAPSMSQQPTALRSLATAIDSPRGLLHMMSFPNFRDLIVPNRTR
ncbi:hypothetical protein OPT61_g2990 [Boeremia exigua]|uniref:Uncharacterized protein n=1 Tax=Boeremia exigua TaxID=749465 RepID=A0ACC2IJH3_9PLEO|nr:hypothetical protein OPT61_g2990 [Boeremia exigua]